MSLQLNVQLNLPKEYNTLVLEYNTYEKASFDQYLAASIAYRCGGETQINKYIDELTGKGSLNEHIKKLVNQVKQNDKNTIEKILNESMFPVTKIDKTNRYVFYPTFNSCVLNNAFYSDLSKYTTEQLKNILMLPYDIINSRIEKRGENDKYENYLIRLAGDILEINISGEWIKFSENDFNKYCKKQQIDIYRYKGKISSKVDGEDWNLLSESYFNSILNINKNFLDDENNYCVLTNDYIKKTEIAKIYGLYFYREKRINFTKENRKYCEMAINSLVNTSQINEVKTKTLVLILQSVDDLLAQKVINYVLNRKDSKEIALLGLELIRSGLEKNWDKSALESIKNYSNTADLNTLYKLNKELSFTLSEIILIDNDILSKIDIDRKQQYLENRSNKIKEIQYKIGIITTSGLRENAKKVLSQSDQNVKKFTKYCNELIGHVDKNLEELSEIQLDNVLKKVNDFYDLYLLVKEVYDQLK